MSAQMSLATAGVASGAATARVTYSAPVSFVRDLLTVARRSLRAASREPAAVIPSLIIPIFFFAVNVGSLGGVANAMIGLDYTAFQLPVAVIFAVTGVSRANALVADISSGYFERLLLTPINRLALLLGMMVADFVLVVLLCLPVLAMGFIVGVSFATGIVGMVAFVLLYLAPLVLTLGDYLHNLVGLTFMFMAAREAFVTASVYSTSGLRGKPSRACRYRCASPQTMTAR